MRRAGSLPGRRHGLGGIILASRRRRGSRFSLPPAIGPHPLLRRLADHLFELGLEADGAGRHIGVAVVGLRQVQFDDPYGESAVLQSLDAERGDWNAVQPRDEGWKSRRGGWPAEEGRGKAVRVTK